ncbi:MAG: hypothetical protein A2007_00460 [Verrucomicrobia bacterium GWC2_42_7]|nr:MAG: hypothetical protein A2007_00460 [Verrucomicrobia bacterium GWC2_42_7]
MRRAAKKAVLDTAHIVKLPLGLLGFPELKEMEIVYSKAELPFMRLRQVKENNRLEFMIIEPNGLIDNYKIEISDQDLLFLGIEGPNDVLVLNIATIHNSMVTINLIGPIIVNRKTRLAKQVVIENHTQYSENHVLYQGEM